MVLSINVLYNARIMLSQVKQQGKNKINAFPISRKCKKVMNCFDINSRYKR